MSYAEKKRWTSTCEHFFPLVNKTGDQLKTSCFGKWKKMHTAKKVKQDEIGPKQKEWLDFFSQSQNMWQVQQQLQSNQINCMLILCQTTRCCYFKNIFHSWVSVQFDCHQNEEQELAHGRARRWLLPFFFGSKLSSANPKEGRGHRVYSTWTFVDGVVSWRSWIKYMHMDEFFLTDKF